ncbi:hypothetical protein BpHYR1_007764, partial [Brachionus plicatilis]
MITKFLKKNFLITIFLDNIFCYPHDNKAGHYILKPQKRLPTYLFSETINNLVEITCHEKFFQGSSEWQSLLFSPHEFGVLMIESKGPDMDINFIDINYLERQ